MGPHPLQRRLSDAAGMTERDLGAVLARRDVVGGTAPTRVRDQVARWRHQLQHWNEATSR